MISELDNKNIEVSEMIFRIFQLSYRLEADIIGIDDFHPLHRTSGQIVSADSILYGFTENEKLAGVIELERTATQIDIASLVVNVEFLRRGIANSLINHVVNAFPKSEIAVSTAEKNYPATTLYKKSGFLEEKVWNTDCGLRMISFRFKPKYMRHT